MIGGEVTLLSPLHEFNLLIASKTLREMMMQFVTKPHLDKFSDSLVTKSLVIV